MNTSSGIKQNLSYLSSIVLIVFSLLFGGCGGDSTPSASEVTTKQLTANTWKISTVFVNDTDKTSLFTNMTLRFTPTTYTTTNGSAVWPATGTWVFTDDTASKIKRDDDVEVTLTEITDSSLKLSLNWATGTIGPGRTSSVAGDHVFSFVK
jgi:hypothetical protein